MIILCPKCSVKYFVNANYIKKIKERLECYSCGHKWFYKSKKNKSSQNKLIENKVLHPWEDETDLIKEQKINFPIEDSSKNKKSWLFFFFLFFFTIIFLSTIYFKDKIRLNFPITKKFYIFMGLENKELKQYLIFQNIEKDINVLTDGSKIVTILGKVNNSSETSQNVPRLRATLLDSQNNVLTTWFFYADNNLLLPKETTKFETNYISQQDEEVDEIKIDFFRGDGN